MKCTVVLFATVMAMVSCSKDDEESQPPTNTELITRSAWKFEDAGADLDKNGSIDFSLADQIPDCVLDNTLTLSTGGTGAVDAGAVKCDPSEPQSAPVTWSFANNETALTIGGAGIIGISGQFKIVTLNETSLALSKDTVFQGASTALVVKLKH